MLSFSHLAFSQLILGSATSFNTIDNPQAYAANGWFQNGSWPACERPPAGEKLGLYLFDLVADPTEHHDLSRTHPDVVEEGRAQIRKFMTGPDNFKILQPNVPNPLGTYVLHNITWSPFLDAVDCVKAVQRNCGHVRGEGKLGCDECITTHRTELEAEGCCLENCGGILAPSIYEYCSVY